MNTVIEIASVLLNGHDSEREKATALLVVTEQRKTPSCLRHRTVTWEHSVGSIVVVQAAVHGGVRNDCRRTIG